MVISRHEFEIVVDEEALESMPLVTRLHQWLISLDAISDVDRVRRYVLESDNKVSLSPLAVDNEGVEDGTLASYMGGLGFNEMNEKGQNSEINEQGQDSTQKEVPDGRHKKRRTM